MTALCKVPTKSAGIGLSITAVCKNAGKKTLGQDDFFVVATWPNNNNNNNNNLQRANTYIITYIKSLGHKYVVCEFYYIRTQNMTYNQNN